MLYFQFKNKGFSGNFTRISEHVVQVTGGVPETGGFKVYCDESKQVFIGDYSDYTTIYRKDMNQLSNDGSHYVPPVPPPEPQPTISTLVADGVEYTIADFASFGDITFLIKNMTLEEVTEVFREVEKVTVDGVEYSNLKFQNAYQVERYKDTYIMVDLHQKTEQELKIESLEIGQAELESTIIENYEAQEEVNSSNEMAIIELYELIGE